MLIELLLLTQLAVAAPVIDETDQAEYIAGLEQAVREIGTERDDLRLEVERLEAIYIKNLAKCEADVEKQEGYTEQEVSIRESLVDSLNIQLSSFESENKRLSKQQNRCDLKKWGAGILGVAVGYAAGKD